MPRGCKLGLGPHSAGSWTGKSDHTGSTLGSLQFCKRATQMWLQDLFDLKGRDEMKECQGRFCWLFVACHGAKHPCCTGQRQWEWAKGTGGCSPVALSIPSKGQAFPWSGWEHLQVQTQGLYHLWGESHSSPPTNSPRFCHGLHALCWNLLSEQTERDVLLLTLVW